VDSTLRKAAERHGLDDMLAPLRPRLKEYADLVTALEDYRDILDRGGWPAVSPGATLRQGDHGTRVRALRNRLRATDDLDAPEDAKPVYDHEVAAAVARFQERHGLPTDSAVNAATLAALDAYAGELERNDYRAVLEGRSRADARLGSERVFGFGATGQPDAERAELLEGPHELQQPAAETVERRGDDNHRVARCAELANGREEFRVARAVVPAAAHHVPVLARPLPPVVPVVVAARRQLRGQARTSRDLHGRGDARVKQCDRTPAAAGGHLGWRGHHRVAPVERRTRQRYVDLGTFGIPTQR
jgi:hypothetical protein